MYVGNISIGEECAYPLVSVPTIVVKQPQFNDSNLLDEHGSPKRKVKAMLSGNKPVDQLLHTIIDNILRGEFVFFFGVETLTYKSRSSIKLYRLH